MRIPERFRAASNPMFDMVVATTMSPVSMLRALRCVVRDLLFDGQFFFIWKLESIAAEQLDAVVPPGIVRSGHPHARMESMSMGEERDSRRGDDTGAFHVGSGAA